MSVLPLVQVLVVLAVTTGCGWLLQRLRQPPVVGQIAGGLLLGPLVLGQVSPRLEGWLFPPAGLGALEMLSRVGLILFLFLVGAELDLHQVRQGRGAVAAITAGSVLLPFLLGVSLAPILWRRFPGSGGFVTFALFVGVAMSITALPVLASILDARARQGRPVAQQAATLALLSASINDLLGWCVLAAVLAVVKHTGGGRETLTHIAELLVFVAAMLYGVRPLLRRVLSAVSGGWAVVVLLPAAFAGAAVTEALGLHAFFGAFLAGLCVPRHSDNPGVGYDLQRLLRPATQALLPLFFALTGLRLQPGLFRSGGFSYLILIVCVAVAGKVAGAGLTARWCGLNVGTAGGIGILLNTRGLVELIVLNVGYREGVLSAGLFTLFVLMALITTAMTAPLLDLWQARSES